MEKKSASSKKSAAKTKPASQPATGGPVANATTNPADAVYETVIPGEKILTGAITSPPKPDVPPVNDRALVVRSRSPKGFRRAGHAFVPEPKTIPVRLLSETEFDAITNDPDLIVEIIAIDEGPDTAE